MPATSLAPVYGWFTLAATQGNVNAQYYLGQMCRRGDRVPQNYETAINWYTLAAKQGDASAKNKLKKLKSELVTQMVDKCLFEEIKKVTGFETKRIVEKHCLAKMGKKSLDWLLKHAN